MLVLVKVFGMLILLSKTDCPGGGVEGDRRMKWKDKFFVSCSVEK